MQEAAASELAPKGGGGGGGEDPLIPYNFSTNGNRSSTLLTTANANATTTEFNRTQAFLPTFPPFAPPFFPVCTLSTFSSSSSFPIPHFAAAAECTTHTTMLLYNFYYSTTTEAEVVAAEVEVVEEGCAQ